MNTINRIETHTQPPDRLVQIIEWFRSESHRYFAIASPVVIGLWGGFDKSRWYNGWLLFGLGVLFAIVAVLLQPRRPSYHQLKLDYKHLLERFDNRGRAVERSIESLLQKLAEHCGADTHHDRVSAYYYHDGNFVMIARHSKNPELRRDGRRIYPSDQGAIGSAWSSREGKYVKSFPSDHEKWIKSMMRDGLSREVAEKLTMKSRKIAAIRIEDVTGSVGILVLESTELPNIGSETLERVRNSLVYSAIADFVGNSSVETPKAARTGAGVPSSLYDADWKPAAGQSSSQ